MLIFYRVHFKNMLTLSSRWMIMGTSLASMTACTCCWLPAVMLDRNHTASYRTKTATTRFGDHRCASTFCFTEQNRFSAHSEATETQNSFSNWIRIQTSAERQRHLVETKVLRVGRGRFEALIIDQSQSRPLLFMTGLRCTPISACIQHPSFHQPVILHSHTNKQHKAPHHHPQPK